MSYFLLKIWINCSDIKLDWNKNYYVYSDNLQTMSNRSGRRRKKLPKNPFFLLQSGDRATVSVFSTCACEELGPLSWIVTGRNQFLSWGTQDDSKEVDSDNAGRLCQYNFK
jgi:hypothetical protein